MILNRLAGATLFVAGAITAAGCSGTDMNGAMGSPQNVRMDPTSLQLSDGSSRPFAVNDLPPDVLEEIHAQFPQAKILRVEERKYLGGQQFYRVHFASASGSEHMMDYNSQSGR